MQSPEDFVISIRLEAVERSPDKLQETVTEPIEMALRSLDRVAEYVSTTTHGSVDIEVKCTDATTERDLAIISDLIGQVQLGSPIMSRLIELRTPTLIWK